MIKEKVPKVSDLAEVPGWVLCRSTDVIDPLARNRKLVTF